MIGGAATLVGCKEEATPVPGKKATTGPAPKTQAGDKYKELHDCAGENVCKGLGGCHVSQEKLEELAKARGIDIKDAGQPHDCSGLNECKGLGGCHVDAEKFAKLKAKLEAKKVAPKTPEVKGPDLKSESKPE